MTEGPWRRDVGGITRCECGHLSSQHRTDLARSSPCYTFPCPCTALRPAVRLYWEHRWVEEALD